MPHIEYLNRFNRWCGNNDLPLSAVVLYYRLLDQFNRDGWPDDEQIDTPRLMLMAGCQKEAAYRARDKLVELGFIEYRKGRKGSPNQYSLTKYTLQKVSESDSVSVSEKCSHIKIKTLEEEKEKEVIPPCIPPGGGPAVCRRREHRV